MSCRLRIAMLLLIAGIHCAATNHQAVAGKPVLTPLTAATTSADTSLRDALWGDALSAAKVQDWQKAVSKGKAAFIVQRDKLPEDSSTICQMLDMLSFWHCRLREFPQSIAAAKEVVERKQTVLAEDAWPLVDSKLKLQLIERLAQLNDHEWQAFLNADRMFDLAQAWADKNRFHEARQMAEQALAIYQKVLGPDSFITLSCRQCLLRCLIEQAEYGKTHLLIGELAEQSSKVRGRLHPQTSQICTLGARLNEGIGELSQAAEWAQEAAEIAAIVSAPDDSRRLLPVAEYGRVLLLLGKLEQAEPLLKECYRQQCKLLGKEHPETTRTLQSLGSLAGERGRFEEARAQLDECVEVFSKNVGDSHVVTGSALNARGKMLIDAGQAPQAFEDLRRAAVICISTVGNSHPHLASVLENLALLYETHGDYGQARDFRLYALAVYEQTFGERCLRTAGALERAGRVYLRMQDFALAETYLLRARETYKERLGAESEKTAQVMALLAFVYLGVGDAARAEPLLVESLAILENGPGNESAEYLEASQLFAELCVSGSRFADAERIYRQILKTMQAAENPHHFAIANRKIEFANMLLQIGRIEEAAAFAAEARAVFQAVVPLTNPHWCDVFFVSGLCSFANGENEQAAEFVTKGLELAQSHRRSTGGFESERQRLIRRKHSRHFLDLYLSIPNAENSLIYPVVLACKGATAMQQWSDRQHSSQHTREITSELRSTVRKLAALNLQLPERDERLAWLQQIYSLTMAKEMLEQRLAVESKLLQDGMPEAKMEQVLELVPNDAALIDILTYKRFTVEWEAGSPRIKVTESATAFLLRPGNDVVRVELGEYEPLAEAVANWRKMRGFSPGKGKPDWAARVSDMVWTKLQPYLHDCKTILISPDGIFSELAWGALPHANQRKRYLIEDYAFSVVPMFQLLHAQADHDSLGDETLLLAGGIDYEASTHAESVDGVRQPSSFHFEPLPATALEVGQLRNSFVRQFPNAKVTLLDRDRASEQVFCTQAPEHRWLHLATHGFFAPPNIRAGLNLPERNGLDATPKRNRNSVSDFNRDYLSGLAFTGANAGANESGEDGILTSAELAFLDLSGIELVVLSGCETGLGVADSGEGVFGLQRSLHIAGARSTLGSLWTVSDQKTNLLMQRFYENLWHRKMGKLAALREAQLWMLSGGTPQRPGEVTKRISPHYWAAFTLTGDWR